MTRIESNVTPVRKSAAEVFSFLSDFNNFQSLMPEQVVDWESTPDECSFKIQGMATLGMKIIEKTPNSLIKITSNGKVPFSFFLTCMIQEDGQHSNVQLAFDAELNAMMKMMAVKPLTNFLNLLAGKLSQIMA
jgi:carbon monoxide dehydrogenase subunit G